MKQYLAAVATGLVLLAPPAQAEDVTFQFLFDGGYPLSVSDDGTIVAGNLSNGGFGAFRWTQADGVTALGRVTHGGGGGKTSMSADGTKISATISTAPDSLLRGQGLWTLGSGWQDLAPLPPDAAFQDGGIGSAWAMSGDGTTVVGLYTRTNGGRAHASKWTAGTGMFDIGQTNHLQASRANGVNYDGSVVVGWVEHWQGPWRPAAWINNAPPTLLTDADTTGATLYGMGQANAVSHNGDYIVGYMSVLPSKQRAATMWKRVGGVFGPPQVLGWVDGTTPEYGLNEGEAVSENGDIVIGYCTYDGDPFSTTGFVWTAETGVIDVNQYLAQNGVLVDPNFGIQSLSAMTPDGLQIFGFGQMLVPPYTRRAFKITRSGLVGVPGLPAVAGLELSAPRPNPSAATSRFEFTLPVTGSADLSIYDTAGRRVTTLLRENLPAGPRTATWDGRDAAGRPVHAGVYFARLVTEQGSSSRRVVRVN